IHTGEIGFRIIKCMEHSQISIPQSVAAHTEGNDVRSVRRPIGGIEPILTGKPFIKWCLGDRGEHADRGMDHTGLLDETDLPIENVQAVMIETDDHPTPDLDPVGLDGMHLFYHAALLTAQVLQLTRFTRLHWLTAVSRCLCGARPAVRARHRPPMRGTPRWPVFCRACARASLVPGGERSFALRLTWWPRASPIRRVSPRPSRRRVAGE